MIIHETSQNLPKNNPFLLGTVSLSLFYFSYLADKLVEFGLLALTIVGLKLISTYFTRRAFNPKTLYVDASTSALKYSQGSTVYFRLPLDDIVRVQIQKESFSSQSLMIYTVNDSYQVPNSDNFDSLQLKDLMKNLKRGLMINVVKAKEKTFQKFPIWSQNRKTKSQQLRWLFSVLVLCDFHANFAFSTFVKFSASRAEIASASSGMMTKPKPFDKPVS